MNRKTLPLLLMLIAGAITAIMNLALEYPLKNKLFALLLVLLIFYFLGCFIQNLLDWFDKLNAERAEAEGEVIEKEADSEAQGRDENG